MSVDLKSREKSRQKVISLRKRRRISRLLRLWLVLSTRLAMARVVREQRRRSRGSANIPAYLRRDIGLPPEIDRWDHQ